MPQVHLTHDALTALPAPKVCVLDYMWLLYRFKGGSGRELVRFVQSQIRSAYKAGCVCFVALGDNDARVPEEKRAEQRRRDKRSAIIDGANRFLTHDHAPANWCEALSDRTFKQAVLLYLHHNVEPPSDMLSNVSGARLITRFASCGARLFCCAPNGEGWKEDTITDLGEVVRDGEADLAAARCIEWLAANQPYDSFVPVGEEVLHGVSTDNVHACAFEVPSDGFAGLWWEESRRIVDMRHFNEKLNRGNGLKDIKLRITRAFSTVDPVRNYAKFFRVAASRLENVDFGMTDASTRYNAQFKSFVDSSWAHSLEDCGDGTRVVYDDHEYDRTLVPIPSKWKQNAGI
ncbi:hypothetical protein CYMTET_39198 [Cymbomonas tetramitiformis]|uniref:Uncharacterized protein n=1 Tax=Cymbomonas tetramitiformis TaxID=36881 RepID=A0AAE0CC92_9CHLO|nr:hypothetical protein CYMTET_39198 [Cymbomonas tetramitiformis]